MDSRRETWGWRNCRVAHPILPKRTQSGNVPCGTGHPNSSQGQVIRVSSGRTGLNSWLLRARCPVPTELDGPAAQLGWRMRPGRGTDHTPKVGASRTASALIPRSHASSTPPSACTKVLTGGSSAGSWLPRGGLQTWTKRLGIQSHPSGPGQAPSGSNSCLFHVNIAGVRPQSLLMSVSALNLTGIDDSLSSRD